MQPARMLVSHKLYRLPLLIFKISVLMQRLEHTLDSNCFFILRKKETYFSQRANSI